MTDDPLTQSEARLPIHGPVLVGFQVNESLRETLDRLAFAHGRSRSQEMRTALLEYIERHAGAAGGTDESGEVARLLGLSKAQYQLVRRGSGGGRP